jgi:ferritin-like metal-binding protein YciE
MSRYEQKIVQYLEEAHATEVALIRVLQSQIAMTPRGTLRTALETHLGETHDHADRVRTRIKELQSASRANPLQAWIGLTEAVVGQALALGKAPLDMVRGNSGEEKLLKNAKDDCATEGLEIATYTAIERLARQAGDRDTAELAKSILADERRMLDRLLEEIPKLTEAVAKAELDGRGTFDATATGAADAAREVAETATRTAKAAAKRTTKAAGRTQRTAQRATQRTTRRAAASSGSSGSRSSGSGRSGGTSRGSGTTRGSGTSRPGSGSGTTARSGGTSASRSSSSNGAQAPISGYDGLNATEIVERLPSLSQSDLAAVKRYERAHENRSTVIERADALTDREPWTGYDEQDVADIRARLRDTDEGTAQRVREYERRHKDRSGVIEATERQPAGAQS